MIAILGLATSICLPTEAQSLVFTDNNFVNTDWTSLKIDDTTLDRSATYTTHRASAGGNPGPFRQVDCKYSYDGTGGIQGEAIANVLESADYIPSAEGAINSISYSFDLKVNVALNGAPGLAFGLLVLQDGKHFVHFYAGTSLIGYRTWNEFAENNLHSTNFPLISTNAYPGPVTTEAIYPDFSSSGHRMQFGFVVFSGVNAGAATTRPFSVGIDNFSARLSYLPKPVLIGRSATKGFFHASRTNVVSRSTIDVPVLTDLFARIPLTTNDVADISTLSTNVIDSPLPAQLFRAVAK